MKPIFITIAAPAGRTKVNILYITHLTDSNRINYKTAINLTSGATIDCALTLKELTDIISLAANEDTE